MFDRIYMVMRVLIIAVVIGGVNTFGQINLGIPDCLPEQPEPACNGLGTNEDCVRLFRHNLPMSQDGDVNLHSYFGKAAVDALLKNKNANFGIAGVSVGEDEPDLANPTYTRSMLFKLFPNAPAPPRLQPQYYGWDNQISAILVGANIKLTLWEESNYQGKSWVIVGPQYITSLTKFGWNDRISSFKVCAYRRSDETDQ